MAHGLETREIAYKGYTASIRSDSIWMTVYDTYGEPCGTIERPHRGVSTWLAHTGNGIAPNGTSSWPCVGPNQALRKIAMYHGA